MNDYIYGAFYYDCACLLQILQDTIEIIRPYMYDDMKIGRSVIADGPFKERGSCH